MMTTLQLAMGPLVAGVAWLVFARFAIAESDAKHAVGRDLDGARWRRLREHSPVVRYAEDLVRELAESSLVDRLADRERIQRSLDLSNQSHTWRADVYVAASATAAVGVTLACGVLGGLVLGGPMPTLLAPIVGWLAFTRQLGELHATARRRIAALRRGLPYAIDLMSLMIEAGAEPPEAIATAARTTAGTPVGEELLRLKNQMGRGASFARGLEQMQRHGDCEEVQEFVRAIQKAEERGNRLSDTMFRLAETMRQKRLQRAEERVGKAQVQMSFPGVVIMVACLLVVLAVFVIPAVQSGGLF